MISLKCIAQGEHMERWKLRHICDCRHVECEGYAHIDSCWSSFRGENNPKKWHTIWWELSTMTASRTICQDVWVWLWFMLVLATKPKKLAWAFHRHICERDNLAYMMPFMLAGAAAAAFVIIIITISLLKGPDKTK